MEHSPTALTPNGTLGLNYIGLIAPIVNAIKGVSQKLTDLANTVAGFADHFTTKELTFTRATGDELDVHKLCVDDVCVTRDQFKAMVAASSVGAAPAGDSGNSATSTPDIEPPVITINGDNPAYIHVGDVYSDLGATVTDNVDHNLGIKTYLNGALVSDIVIDTSAEATDTIDYVATDSAGNTATSTRTVIVEAPAI